MPVSARKRSQTASLTFERRELEARERRARRGDVDAQRARGGEVLAPVDRLWRARRARPRCDSGRARPATGCGSRAATRGSRGRRARAAPAQPTPPSATVTCVRAEARSSAASAVSRPRGQGAKKRSVTAGAAGASAPARRRRRRRRTRAAPRRAAGSSAGTVPSNSGRARSIACFSGSRFGDRLQARPASARPERTRRTAAGPA